MTKYARIIDNKYALDVITTKPEESFHPDLLKDWKFIVVPDDTENFDITNDGGKTFQKPVSPESK